MILKYLYTRKLWYEYFTQAFWIHNNLCEFTALAHKFKRWFLTQKLFVLKISGIQEKSDSDFVWQSQFMSIKGWKFSTHTTQIFNL